MQRCQLLRASELFSHRFPFLEFCIQLSTAAGNDTITPKWLVIHAFSDCCADTEFSCQSGSRCINVTAVCDGAYDCPDFSDEISCSKLFGLLILSFPINASSLFGSTSGLGQLATTSIWVFDAKSFENTKGTRWRFSVSFVIEVCGGLDVVENCVSVYSHSSSLLPSCQLVAKLALLPRTGITRSKINNTIQYYTRANFKNNVFLID